MTKQKSIFVLIAIAIISVGIGYFMMHKVAQEREAKLLRERQIKIISHKLDNWDVMSQQEAARIMTIQDATGPLPGKDFDFINTILNNPAKSSDADVEAVRLTHTLTCLVVCVKKHRLSSEQKTKVSKTLANILHTEQKDPLGGSYLMALRAVREINDKQLVADVMPLCNDPREKVRNAATLTLKSLGHAVQP